MSWPSVFQTQLFGAADIHARPPAGRADAAHGAGDAVGAGEVHDAILVKVHGGVLEFPEGVVGVEGGDAIGIDLFGKLSEGVVVGGGGAVVGGDGLIVAAEVVGVGFGPFGGVGAVGEEGDGLGGGTVAINPMDVADAVDGGAGEAFEGSIQVVGLDAGAAVGLGGGVGDAASGVVALGKGGDLAGGVGLGDRMAGEIVGGGAEGDLGAIRPEAHGGGDAVGFAEGVVFINRGQAVAIGGDQRGYVAVAVKRREMGDSSSGSKFISTT